MMNQMNIRFILSALLLIFPLLAPAAATAQTTGTITDPQYEQLRRALLGGFGRLTQRWGDEFSGNYTRCTNTEYDDQHPGIDYGGSSGKTVYSPVAGVVTNVARGSDCTSVGCLSTLAIYNSQLNKTYVFLHMEAISVASGNSVSAGQELGTVGKRGAGAAHLHYEVREGSKTSAAVCINGTVDPFVNTPLNNQSSTAWEFSSAGNFEGWTIINISAAKVENGTLLMDPWGDDPYLQSPEIGVDAAAIRFIEFSLASNAPDGRGEIYFKTAAENYYSPERKKAFAVANCSTCGGNAPFHYYPVDMSSHPSWRGRITGIRIDPAKEGRGGTNTDSIGIEYVRFSLYGGDGGGAADELAPALTINTPANNQTVRSGVVTVSGTASDAGRGESGVAAVTVGGTRAANDTAANSGTASWSRNVTLSPGANTITVVAKDNSPAQNSVSRALTVYYQTSNTDPTPTPMPTPTPTPPVDFTSDASVNQNPAAVNQPATLLIFFQSSGGASDVTVDTEIYNAGNHRVYQSFTPHINFAAGQARGYPLDWTPAAAGRYTVKTAVFNRDWSINHHWNDAALVIDVTGDETPPASPPAFSATAVAAPNPGTANQPVSISATATNSGGAVADVLVDVEVYDAANNKVFQNVFEHQNFGGDAAQTFAAAWTPAASGQFTVKVGVFSGDWTTNYAWNDLAATITVNAPPPASGYDLSVWWVTDGAQVSGTQPFKAVVDNLALSQYTMSWQVDGGALVPMSDNYQDAPHKEASVDLSGWTWRGTGPYRVNFVAKNAHGNIIAERAVRIFVSQ